VKILVTGSNGQLGSEIRRLANHYKEFDFVFTDVGELDITDNRVLSDFFSDHTFDCIINCAAYTLVDKAEDEKDLAMLVNSTAPGYLAVHSRKMNALMVHISTDYVFDGEKNSPYTETEQTNPLSYYGLTKLRGEEQVIKHSGSAFIIRTSWLYSSFGSNFVKTILNRGRMNKQLSVVADQTGSPTYARDLAKCILNIIPLINKGGSEIYHYTNEGEASWYEFAAEIIKIAGLACSVIPVSTSDYPTKARRPFYSVLDKNKIQKVFNITIPHWKDSLRECIDEIPGNF
jgi:dTDP-4-dehydrorhamnose reductase